MVDALQLASDIVETSVYLATPPLLWVGLFLFSWGDPARAQESGFGRRTFWLLLPGALLGTLADLPFFHWSNDYLAINIGGGLIPIVLSALLLGRLFPDRARLLTVLAIALSVASYLALAGVLIWPDGRGLDLYVLGVGVAAPGALALASQAPKAAQDRQLLRTAAILLGLTELALVPTFLSTASVPGLGIVSAFPWYLVPPVAVGLVAFVAGPLLLGVSRAASTGIAYAATTLGVLVGADVLREPPLYAGSSAGLYAIGGAGTGDLLYLSGLLAFAAAAVALRFVPPRAPPAAVDVGRREGPLPAAALLRRGLVHAVEGRTAEAVQDSHAAVEAAIERADAMVALAHGETGRPDRARLPAPEWVVADRTNLAALARSTSLVPADATRAWMTARWIVRHARGVARSAFASLPVRAAAFLLDLAFLTAPAGLLWYYVVVTTQGTITDLLTSVSLNVVLLLYTSVGLLYFVILEGLYGTTLGKALWGLRVRAREADRPGPRAVFVRGLPKLVPLTGVGVLVIVGIFLVVRGSSVSVSIVGGVAFTLGAVLAVAGYLATFLGVCGAVSGLVMHLTPERQRFGDLLADTWVVQITARTAAGPPGPASAPSA